MGRRRFPARVAPTLAVVHTGIAAFVYVIFITHRYIPGHLDRAAD
jgi:hypothetical protein